MSVELTVWLSIAAYVLIGIGTARYAVAKEYAEMVIELIKTRDMTFARAREKAWEDYPFTFAFLVFMVSWPLLSMWAIATILVKFVAPTIGQWFRAPIDRRFRQEGLIE